MGSMSADRAALDANYNLRAKVPEHPVYSERYARASAAFRARWPGRLDLPYGDSPRQAVDLFLPEARGRRYWPSSTAAIGKRSIARISRLSASGWSRRGRGLRWSATI